MKVQRFKSKDIAPNCRYTEAFKKKVVEKFERGVLNKD
jgi:hypothetical protein